MNERRIIQTGIDVSRYQGKIDWARVKAGGTGFAIIKCTQGVNTVDPEFHRNMRNCAAVRNFHAKINKNGVFAVI